MSDYIKKAISDIMTANDQNVALVALALALTLSDICCQAELAKNKSSREDYVEWCNKWMPPKNNWDMDGKKYYALRCAILHNGNDDICKQDILMGTPDESNLFFNLKILANTGVIY